MLAFTSVRVNPGSVREQSSGGREMRPDDSPHTNAYWSGGAGPGKVVTPPQVTVDLRAERESIRDTTQRHVATVWPL